MGSDALLQPACELSYVVARDGVESRPPVDAPTAMRSFLYVAELPPRALTVAQQAIEDDPSFRRRVAEQATEDEVGRAGYLWLHRPIGWAAEFEQLSSSDDGAFDVAEHPADAAAFDHGGDLHGGDLHGGDLHGGDLHDDDGHLDDLRIHRGDADPLFTAETIDVPTEGMPTGYEVRSTDESAVLPRDNRPPVSDELDGVAAAISAVADELSPSPGAEVESVPARPVPSGRSEANAIEDELSSLRGLVDRLSNERKAVAGSVRRVEHELQTSKAQPSVFDADIYTLRSELETARSELEAARAERDAAVQKQSESLTHQLDLERELERSRSLRIELEEGHAEVDAELIEIREALSRTTSTLDTTTSERDSLQAQLHELKQGNDELTRRLDQFTEERDSVIRNATREVETLQVRHDELLAERTALVEQIAQLEVDLAEQAQLGERLSSQSTESGALIDALTEEKIDLASRLADTEAMLETNRAQLTAVKADSEAIAADLSTVKAHRDGLSSQVDELHGSLTEALADLARVRSSSDADRDALKEVRNERDMLRARVTSLEQVETGLGAKLNAITVERDDTESRLEQARSEVAARQREIDELVAERDRMGSAIEAAGEESAELQRRIEEVEGELTAVRKELAEVVLARDGLARQVDELTEENSAIQGQLLDAERTREEAATNHGLAVSELAHRLSMVETERTRFEQDRGEIEIQLNELQEALADEQERASDLQSQLEAATAEMEAARADLEHVRSDLAQAEQARHDAEQARQETEQRVEEAERARQETEQRVQEAERARQETEQRVQEAEQARQDAELRVQDAEQRVQEVASQAEELTAQVRDAAAAATEAGPVGASVHLAPPADVGLQDEVDIEGPQGPVDVAGEAVSAPVLEEPLEAPSGPEQDEAKGPLGRAARLFRRPAEHAVEPDGVRPPPPTRGDAAPPPPPAPVTGGDDEPVTGGDHEPVTVSVEEDLVADVPSAPVSAEEVVPGDEIEEVSSQLAKLLGSDRPTVAVDDGDEDLDSISDLISQTVTDFDPASVMPSVEGDEDAVALEAEPPVAETDGDVEPEPDRSERRLFAFGDRGRAPERGGRPDRLARSAPPSIFDAEGDDATTVGPSTAMVDAVPPPPTEEGTADLAPSTTVAGRRVIEIPPDVLADEVEMARYVVSSPDVVLLVDGDSVASMGWPSLTVAQQRDALVSYLADLSTSTGAAPDVVFDGRIGEEDSLPASRAVRIRLSSALTEPTAALDELVDAYPEQWPIALVTDDEELAASAATRGAAVLNNGQLLDLFISQ